MGHNIHRPGLYEGYETDVAARAIDGGFKIAYHTARVPGANTETLVVAGDPFKIFPTIDAAFEAGEKSVRQAIDARRV